MPDLAALTTGTKLVIGAALLLLIDTFFAWQKVCTSFGETEVCASANAWHGFWGVVLGLLTIALLVWVGLQLANIAIGIDLPHGTVTLALAALIGLFALLKNLIDDHSAWASYVGLVLAAAVVYGAWLRKDEGAPQARETTPAPPPAAPPPAASPPA